MPLPENNIKSELGYASLHAVAARAGVGCEAAGRQSAGETDVTDSRWIAGLLRPGLLKPGFVPPRPVGFIRSARWPGCTGPRGPCSG